MKNIARKFLGTFVLLMGPVVVALSQPQPPSNNDVITGGQVLNCPVGNGYWLLLAFAVGYAAFKVWQMRKSEQVA